MQINSNPSEYFKFFKGFFVELYVLILIVLATSLAYANNPEQGDFLGRNINMNQENLFLSASSDLKSFKELNKGKEENRERTQILAKNKFIVYPESPKKDPEILPDDFLGPGAESDPVSHIEKELLEERKKDPTMSDEEFIRRFKENAEKAGLKIKIDPETLKVTPLPSSSK